jgi:hypothetical protein
MSTNSDVAASTATKPRGSQKSLSSAQRDRRQNLSHQRRLRGVAQKHADATTYSTTSFSKGDRSPSTRASRQRG